MRQARSRAVGQSSTRNVSTGTSCTLRSPASMSRNSVGAGSSVRSSDRLADAGRTDEQNFRAAALREAFVRRYYSRQRCLPRADVRRPARRSVGDRLEESRP